MCVRLRARVCVCVCAFASACVCARAENLYTVSLPPLSCGFEVEMIERVAELC